MRYERRKEITAFLSITSVLVTIVAALSMNMFIDGLTKSFTLVTGISALIAAMAAIMSIMMSRHLERERERRRIFLIYAREDIEAARQLADELKQNGYNPWLDVLEITPGQIWQRAVLRALEESSIAIVLISQHLSKQGFVQKELKIALDTLQEKEKDMSPVIPVRLDDSPVPDRLSHVQWVNLFEANGMERLLMGLSKISKNAQQSGAREQKAAP